MLSKKRETKSSPMTAPRAVPPELQLETSREVVKFKRWLRIYGRLNKSDPERTRVERMLADRDYVGAYRYMRRRVLANLEPLLLAAPDGRLVAQILQYLPLRDLSPVCKASASMREICKRYELKERRAMLGVVFKVNHTNADDTLSAVTTNIADRVVHISAKNNVYLLESGHVWAGGKRITVALDSGYPLLSASNAELVQIEAANEDESFLFALTTHGDFFGLTSRDIATRGTQYVISSNLGPLYQVASISTTSNNNVFAIMRNGHCYARGPNSYGQCGTGRLSNNVVLQFERVLMPADDPRVTQVACGWYHSVFLSSTNVAYVSGFSTHGQLAIGDDRFEKVYTPRRLPISDVTFIACGDKMTAVIQHGRVWSCGLDYMVDKNGHMEYTSRASLELRPLPDGVIVSVACGGRQLVTLDNTGRVYFAGRSGRDTLWHGYLTIGSDPVRVRKVFASGDNTFVIASVDRKSKPLLKLQQPITCTFCGSDASPPLHACVSCKDSAFCSDACGEDHECD